MINMADTEMDQFEFDFGTPVAVITKAEEFMELPNEVAQRRAEREAAKPVKREIAEVDGQAKAAAIAELPLAVHTGLPFTYDGETYHVDPVDEWDLDIFENQEDGKLITLVRNLLGDVQWSTFKTQPDGVDGARKKRKRTIKELLEILDVATKAAGSNAGE